MKEFELVIEEVRINRKAIQKIDYKYETRISKLEQEALKNKIGFLKYLISLLTSGGVGAFLFKVMFTK